MITRILSISDGMLIKEMKSEGAAIVEINFTPDGQYLLITENLGEGVGEIKVWQIKNNVSVAKIDSEKNILHYEFTADSKLFAGIGEWHSGIFSTKDWKLV